MKIGNKQDPQRLQEASKSRGEQLAEGKWSRMVEGLTGMDAIVTAMCLENTQKVISETVRATNVGNFDRFAFPLIRAVMPNLIATEIVSVQPMDGPVGLVFFFSIIYGSQKGSIQAGTQMFSPLTGHPTDDFYSGPEIRDESIGTGDGVTAAFTPNLGYTPVVPGTLSLTDGTQEVTDDGSGALVGAVNPGGTNTINYATGAVNVTFATAPASSAALTASYEYENEANQLVPEVDLQLTSEPVVARINKLRTRYSLEAAQNLRALHGLSAENELMLAMANELRFEIDRTIIKDLRQSAMADAVTWPQTPPTGVSFTEHKLSFVDILIRGSNNIFRLTRRGQPNWLVMGVEVSSVVESLPNFTPSDEMKSQNGVIYAGTLQGRWKCYKDPYNIDGTSNQRNFLIGYKGDTFLEAGYVYAPYIPFYTTPTVVLDDFLGRKGMATQWGKKKVNGRWYAPGTVTGSFAP